MNPRWRLSSGIAWTVCLLLGPAAFGQLRPVAVPSAAGVRVEVRDGQQAVLLPVGDASSLVVVEPSGTTPVRFAKSEVRGGVLHLAGGSAPGLEFTETYRNVTPELIERSVTVKARSAERYYLDLGWKTPADGKLYSFMGPENTAKRYTPSCSGPEFREHSSLTFPFLGYRVGNRLWGIVGDTPGLWENRCFLEFDPGQHRLSLRTGDGSAMRSIGIPVSIGGSGARADFDGWQHLAAGGRQTFTTWLFASPVKSLYDVQLAAHLALANAKGFNHSGLEAILRNTSYLLLRRNLLRPESDYLFISGVGYGWKQWVTDGFYMSRGLDDPKYDEQAYRAVFDSRITYEDNAQYYLIWATLVKRAGGKVNDRLIKVAWDFLRANEKDGVYVPPSRPGTTGPSGFKTYMDLLKYDAGDAPVSNQGFHCGAMLAARELGLGATEEDFQRAVAGYRRMFNAKGGYMPTSAMQPQHVGQDTLYGEVLTFAVFGRKLLPDEMVRKHLETTMRIQSPYGMRVISKANGDLLDGHSGVYTFGGSWFLCDAANYLDGLIHGMDPKWVDDKLVWRLEKELAYMPAFHESISTVTGRPHGHHLYSWNSGYWWLRREVRRRLGMQGPDPVESRLDAELGVSRRDGHLVLAPDAARLRPEP